MDNVLAWGLDFIRSVQTIGNPVLTTVMKAITFTGSEIAYLAAIPFIFWCYDERKGLRLATAFLLSAWVNCSLKEVWRQPRPYELDPSVGMAVENSFGLPSGHAQGSATFWGIIAGWMRSPYGIVFAIAMPLVVGFSRIYLGVHFPTDVVAGWLLGAGVLGLYYGFGSSMEALLAGANSFLIMYRYWYPKTPQPNPQPEIGWTVAMFLAGIFFGVAANHGFIQAFAAVVFVSVTLGLLYVVMFLVGAVAEMSQPPTSPAGGH